MAEYIGATTEFPPYNMTQMLRHSSARTPRQPSHRLEILEIVAQQDEIIRGIVVTKEEELDAQQEDVVESDPSDNSDDGYQPIPQMAPRPNDREASGSSLAPPQPPQTD